MAIGKVNTLPWYLKFFIFGVVSLVVYGGFWYFVTSGTRAATKQLQDQVDLLKKQNAQAQVASQRLNNFRASYKAKQEEYDELKALLPEQRELTNVLQGIQDRTQSCRLVLRKFVPKDDVQQDFYSGKPVEVQVTATFTNLRKFFDQMAGYQRIVSISDFKITRVNDADQYPSNTVDAQFLMTAYYSSAEKLQQQPKPAQGQPNAAPASNPPASAPKKD